MRLVNNNGKIIVLNAQGKPVTLTPREQRVADFNQRMCNALGIEVQIDTLTTIIKEVTEQIFYHVAPAEFMPLKVGQGAWSKFLTTYRSYLPGDDFLTGVIDQGTQGTKLAQVNAAVDAVTVPVQNWAKELVWNLMEIEQAQKAGNWDLITELEIGRKTNWDLGIQSIAFLGAAGLTGVYGLFTLPNVNINQTLITQSISSMTTDQRNAMIQGLLSAYRANNANTAWPTHWAVPQSDFLGWSAPWSPDFPIKSILEVMLETLRTMTNNPNFKILPVAYGDSAYNGLGHSRFALYNYNPRSMRMDLPVDYTNSLMNTANGFTFKNVGYGQFTGLNAYRPLEALYFDHT